MQHTTHFYKDLEVEKLFKLLINYYLK